MFRNLGTLALLALCLFAIVIVMGSCGERIQPMIAPIEVPETVETVTVPETEALETKESDTEESDTED